MKGAGYPAGVPTPYVAHVHPYPTRFHGGIWTRPVFGFPQLETPTSVFIPGRDIEMQPDKPYVGNVFQGQNGMGSVQYNTGEGIFRPGGYGGGVFDGNLAGAPALGKRGASTLGDASSDAANYPYGKYSAQTKQLQDKLNTELLSSKLCPIVADGQLGPATCGAAVVIGAGIGLSAPTTCQDYLTPQAQSTGCGTGPKPPATPVTTTSAANSIPSANLPLISSNTKKMLGFALGALGAVGVVYYVKKKRGRK